MHISLITSRVIWGSGEIVNERYEVKPENIGSTLQSEDVYALSSQHEAQDC